MVEFNLQLRRQSKKQTDMLSNKIHPAVSVGYSIFFMLSPEPLCSVAMYY